MPGHTIVLTCECGIESCVNPGETLDKDGFHSQIVIYNAEKETFETMEATEAESLGIRAFCDPYIENSTKFVAEVEEDISQRGYACPRCRQMKLRYHFMCHWD